MSSPTFSPQEKAYFEKMFNLYDTDKSGAIGLSELRNLSKHLGVEMSEAAILETVDKLGYSTQGGDFDLDFNQFVHWLQAANAGGGDEFAHLKAKITAAGQKALNNDQIARLKEVFDEFDADGSGSIDAEELVTVFGSMGQDATVEEMEALIQEVDDDGSGQIEFEEFMVLMCFKFGGKSLETDMQEEFEALDPETTGLITLPDCKKMMQGITGGILSDSEIDKILDSVDKKEGCIEYMKWESLWEACRDSQ